MTYLLIKAILSGIIIAIVSEVSRKYPGFGGLIASLPLISVLGMIWIWFDTADAERISHHSIATFWFVIPSLPMFIALPILLRQNLPFWYSLIICCLLTVILYAIMVWMGQKIGVKF